MLSIIRLALLDMASLCIAWHTGGADGGVPRVGYFSPEFGEAFMSARYSGPTARVEIRKHDRDLEYRFRARPRALPAS
jgi:hypothetical protein